MRPVGEIFLDLEKLYDELVDDHGMQMGDMIYWLHGHLKIHRPDCIEQYVVDNSNPDLYYGPKKRRNPNLKKKVLKYLNDYEGCRMEMKDVTNILRILDEGDR